MCCCIINQTPGWRQRVSWEPDYFFETLHLNVLFKYEFHQKLSDQKSGNTVFWCCYLDTQASIYWWSIQSIGEIHEAKETSTCNFVQSSSLCYLWVPSPHPCLLIFPVPIYSQSIDEFASGVEIVDHFSALSASQEIEKRGFILIFSKATFPCVDGKELAYEFLVYSLMH